MKTLWKQSAGLHPTFAPINRSLEQDWFLLPLELRLQAAHAEALLGAGILTQAEHGAVGAALAGIAADHDTASCPSSEAEDIHTWIESALTARAGDAGRKIHTGRSRNDQVATLLKLFVIEAGSSLVKQLGGLVRSFAEQSLAWKDLVMPLQTHCQFAAPGSVGFWGLRYAASFSRSRERLASGVSAWRRDCPLGAGAVAGSSIPLDRAVQAGGLGFDGAALNALDATSTRDECLDFLFCTAQIGLHLQSFATDVIAFAQTPFQFTVYPPAFGTGSSMMPNKTNPDAMELLRGEANALVAAVQHGFLIVRGLPSGYNRDLQCIKPLVRDAATLAGRLLAMTEPFVGALAWNEARLAQACGDGAIDATLRMEQKVRDGMPLRDAHHAVAADLAGGTPGQVGVDDYATAGSASPAEVARIARHYLDVTDA